MTTGTRPVGVNTWVWTSPLDDAALRGLAPRVAAMGFDLIELPVENPGDWDPKTAASLLDDLGLAATIVLVMPEQRQLVRADAATISHTQDYLRHLVDVAAAVGARTVAGPAYASVGRTWAMTADERLRCYAELRDRLGPVVEHARQAGVVLGVEPLNRYETSVLNTVAQTLEALSGLPADGCGVALDIYHQNIEETDLPAVVRAAAGHIAHVQVCANDRGSPGRDHIDWPGVLGALDASGYGGPLVIESFTAENQAIATAASIWRPLAKTQDALAMDGLAFLRQTMSARRSR